MDEHELKENGQVLGTTHKILRDAYEDPVDRVDWHDAIQEEEAVRVRRVAAP